MAIENVGDPKTNQKLPNRLALRCTYYLLLCGWHHDIFGGAEKSKWVKKMVEPENPMVTVIMMFTYVSPLDEKHGVHGWVLLGKIRNRLKNPIWNIGENGIGFRCRFSQRNQSQISSPWCWHIYLQSWVIFGVNVGKYYIHGASGNPLIGVSPSTMACSFHVPGAKWKEGSHQQRCGDVPQGRWGAHGGIYPAVIKHSLLDISLFSSKIFPFR